MVWDFGVDVRSAEMDMLNADGFVGAPWVMVWREVESDLLAALAAAGF